MHVIAAQTLDNHDTVAQIPAKMGIRIAVLGMRPPFGEYRYTAMTMETAETPHELTRR
jgi:hypothetical protein